MAKQLNLEFDTSDLQLKGEAPDNLPPSSIELSSRVINTMVMQYSEQKGGGLIKVERSQAYWLRENIEKAVATEVKIIEIPDDVFGFLRKVCREVRMDPNKLLQRVEANIDAVKMD